MQTATVRSTHTWTSIRRLDPSDEYGQQNLEALDMAFIADPGRIFFIFDDQLKIRYETDYFERLSDHGIESEKTRSTW